MSGPRTLDLNCDSEKVGRGASLVGCEIGAFPTSFLGLPPGRNPRNLLLEILLWTR